MKIARSLAAAAALYEKIYVMGGQTGKETTNSVECYDPDKNTWTMVAPMIEARSGAQAVVSVGFLYVLGGSTTETAVTIEKYYPNEDKWSKVWFFELNEPFNQIHFSPNTCFRFPIISDKFYVGR